MRTGLCPLCGRRKARRACPALDRQICAVCCGTKRQVEIRCPSDCRYLLTAQVHPAAIVQRRRERDARFLGPLVHDLAQNQYHLFFFVQIFLRRYRATSVPAVVDEDVVEAAAALAATFETSGRGIIYEHRAASLPAQRLATDLQAALDELAGKAAAPRDQDAALVLRRTERAAREATKALEGGQTAYFGLLERVLGESAAAATGEEPSEPPAAEGGSRLIIP